nr:NADH-plastoquinone oxidoreductase subunit 4 [Phalaenopsis stobartiana]WKY96337.1 NADH-plastoquinone oxidoreductase subunit 4 [Phalaenopsis wilsonii]
MCCAFFLAKTSCDRIRFFFISKRWEYLFQCQIPMSKIFIMFNSFSIVSLALPGMSGFVAEFLLFFGIITSPKYPKMLITFVMSIGIILNSIFYYLCYDITSDFLWIQTI